MSYQLTSRAEMSKLFKSVGVEFRAGSENVDCDEVLDFYIDDASSTMLSHLGQVYDSATLAQSNWVRVRATWMACYLLSQMGGNPALFGGRMERIMDEMEKAKALQLSIPDNNGVPLPTTYDMVPSMSNINHDPRYRSQTRRVDPQTSTPSIGGTRERIISEIPGFGLF